MSLIELFEFFFKFNLAAPVTTTWIYMIVAVILMIVVAGLIWGKMWNREWSLGGHTPSLLLVIVSGLGVAYAIFNLQGVGQMEDWFQQQRTTLARSVADSGRFHRAVLLPTWDQLLTKDAESQQGLTPPIEGGNEIRLKSPEDAFALATTAAEETRAALRTKAPFSLGIPISSRNPVDIATETLDTIRFDANRFPTIVAFPNEWVSTAATIQANHALETAYATLMPGSKSLKTASILLLLVSILITLVWIPMNALADIKINPKSKL